MNESDRTLPPTPRRLREARRRGQVPRSRDLAAAATWVAVCASLALMLPRASAAMATLARDALGQAPARASVDVASWLVASLEALGWTCAVPLLVCFAAVLVTGFVFSGPTFSPRAVTPDLARLSPAEGLKRFFSTARWFESGRDLAKLVVLVALAAVVLRTGAVLLVRAPTVEPVHAGRIIERVLVDAALILAVGALAFALVDVVWARHRWISGLRMTPAELKREIRETEGDPMLKGQRKRLHREISEHQVLEEVRRATVVVVNPTHVAVALRWEEEEMDAPTVMATGRNAMARRIIAEARRAGVPVVHDVGLARTLSDLQPGEMIPEKLYEAVAAILRVLEEDA